MTDVSVQSSSSPWRIVEARVLVSLSPAELWNTQARACASRKAMASLLMRFHHALGGVVVAHRGGLRFQTNPPMVRLLGTTPFSHISAVVTLLVFAPKPGQILTAVVSHVGPDHVGMTLWNTFHVVLPIGDTVDGMTEDLPITGATGNRYSYDPSAKCWRFGSSTNILDQSSPSNTPLSARERHAEETTFATEQRRDIFVGSIVRFSVVELRHTKSGLYHVAATLADSNRDASSTSYVALGPISDGPSVKNRRRSLRNSLLSHLSTQAVKDDDDEKAEQEAADESNEEDRDNGDGLVPSSRLQTQARDSDGDDIMMDFPGRRASRALLSSTIHAADATFDDPLAMPAVIMGLHNPEEPSASRSMKKPKRPKKASAEHSDHREAVPALDRASPSPILKNSELGRVEVKTETPDGSERRKKKKQKKSKLRNHYHN